MVNNYTSQAETIPNYPHHLIRTPPTTPLGSNGINNPIGLVNIILIRNSTGLRHPPVTFFSVTNGTPTSIVSSLNSPTFNGIGPTTVPPPQPLTHPLNIITNIIYLIINPQLTPS